MKLRQKISEVIDLEEDEDFESFLTGLLTI